MPLLPIMQPLFHDTPTILVCTSCISINTRINTRSTLPYCYSVHTFMALWLYGFYYPYGIVEGAILPILADTITLVALLLLSPVP